MNNDDPDMPVRYVPRPKVKIQPHPDDPDLPIQTSSQVGRENLHKVLERIKALACEKIGEIRAKNLVMVLFTAFGVGIGVWLIFLGIRILQHEDGASRFVAFLLCLAVSAALLRWTWEMLGKSK